MLFASASSPHVFVKKQSDLDMHWVLSYHFACRIGRTSFELLVGDPICRRLATKQQVFGSRFAAASLLLATSWQPIRADLHMICSQVAAY